MTQAQVFVSYSHKDEAEKDALLTHLRVVGRTGLIDIWSDDRIGAGADWEAEIREAMAGARVAILLVSANFLTSDFILREEVPTLLRRREAEGLTVFPVIAKACAWQEVDWLASMQVRPRNGWPVWADAGVHVDEDLAAIAKEVAAIVKVETGKRPAPPKPAPRAPRRQPFEPELILIPAGEFLMGSDPRTDKDAGDAEQPQHYLYLPNYSIAKTPVTNVQYLAFVQSTGQKPPNHWKSWKPPGGKEDHPVVNVSLQEAMTYCQWLAKVTGRAYRLPSEAEWEKAARGTDGRIYPWGDEWDEKLCNSIEGGLGGTTPVGQYSPGGDSPYGCVDMAGNVLEWTRSLRKGYPYDPEDGRENPRADDPRVLRGGAFVSSRRIVRCVCRDRYFPGHWYWGRGFRVCVAPGSASDL
jgi:formylglycine-generating enzyme required for sulfatase activity